LNARKIAAFAVGPIGSAALGLLIVPFTAWYFPAEDVGRIDQFLPAAVQPGFGPGLRAGIP